MNIIIEGSQCTGKTQLAKWLAGVLNMKYISQSELMDINSYRNLSMNLDRVIIDEFHIRKFVHEPYPEWILHIIERILYIQNTLIIYCDTTMDSKIKNMRIKTNGEVDESLMFNESIRYTKSIEKSILPVIRYDREIHRYDKVFQVVAQHMRKDEYSKFLKTWNHNSIGSMLRRSTVLIGDYRGDQRVFTDGSRQTQELHEALDMIEGSNDFYILDINSNWKDQIMYISPIKILLLGKKIEKKYWNCMKTPFDLPSYTLVKLPKFVMGKGYVREYAKRIAIAADKQLKGI